MFGVDERMIKRDYRVDEWGTGFKEYRKLEPEARDICADGCAGVLALRRIRR